MSGAPARDPALPAVPPGTIARPPRAGAASNGPPPEVCTPPAGIQDEQCGSNVAVVCTPPAGIQDEQCGSNVAVVCTPPAGIQDEQCGSNVAVSRGVASEC